MAEFMLQERPEVSPRSCYTCHSHEGPFVNLMVDDALGRMILLCAPNDNRESGCAGMIVSLIGGLTPAGARKVKEQRDEAVAAKVELEERVEAMRADLISTLS